MSVCWRMICCMNTPERRDDVRRMRGWFSDFGVPLQSFNDFEERGLWFNAKRALTTPFDEDFVVVMTEDISLCPNFIECTTEMLESFPENIISGYAPLAMMPKLHRKGFRAISGSYCSGPMVGWPKKLVADFLSFDAKYLNPSHPLDDLRFSVWSEAVGRDVLIPTASLIDHIGGHRSIYNKSEKRPRISHLIHDGSSVDWKSASIYKWSPTCPAFNTRGGVVRLFGENYQEVMREIGLGSKIKDFK